MSNCNRNYSVVGVDELDIDDLSTLPTYLLGIRAVEDESTGDTIYSPVRVETTKIAPTASMANVIAVTTNNSDLSLDFGDIYGGYIDVQTTGNVMRKADTSNTAQFLMIGDYTNGKMLIQATGFLYISGGHSYNVSSQYYLDEDGAPTTDSAVTGQKLFLPIDDYTLLVNLEA